MISPSNMIQAIHSKTKTWWIPNFPNDNLPTYIHPIKHDGFTIQHDHLPTYIHFSFQFHVSHFGHADLPRSPLGAVQEVQLRGGIDHEAATFQRLKRRWCVRSCGHAKFHRNDMCNVWVCMCICTYIYIYIYMYIYVHIHLMNMCITYWIISTNTCHMYTTNENILDAKTTQKKKQNM